MGDFKFAECAGGLCVHDSGGFLEVWMRGELGASLPFGDSLTCEMCKLFDELRVL
jgi:hypothetical protein